MTFLVAVLTSAFVAMVGGTLRFLRAHYPGQVPTG
jgi:hypothetical protein